MSQPRADWRVFFFFFLFFQQENATKEKEREREASEWCRVGKGKTVRGKEEKGKKNMNTVGGGSKERNRDQALFVCLSFLFPFPVC